MLKRKSQLPAYQMKQDQPQRCDTLTFDRHPVLADFVNMPSTIKNICFNFNANFKELSLSLIYTLTKHFDNVFLIGDVSLILIKTMILHLTQKPRWPQLWHNQQLLLKAKESFSVDEILNLKNTQLRESALINGQMTKLLETMQRQAVEIAELRKQLDVYNKLLDFGTASEQSLEQEFDDWDKFTTTNEVKRQRVRSNSLLPEEFLDKEFETKSLTPEFGG